VDTQVLSGTQLSGDLSGVLAIGNKQCISSLRLSVLPYVE